MKIFLSFLQSQKNHPIAAYSFWEYYIKNGIKEAGFEWAECNDVDWAAGLVPQSDEQLKNWKTISWTKTVNYLRKNPTDIFLSYLYPHQIDEIAISEIKRMGIKCINFFCDNVRMFKKAPNEFAVFDLNWVPEHKALDLYAKSNFSYIHLPMPMWVEPKFRSIPIEENDNISFIGSKDIQRQLFFEQLVEQRESPKLDIYGNGWIEEGNSALRTTLSPLNKITNQFKFISSQGIKAYLNKLKFSGYNPPISTPLRRLLKGKLNFEEYINVTRESKITLGINRYPSFNYPLNFPNTYSRLRDIEAPMVGACYLTEWTSGLALMYDLETEIFTYKTVDELITQCDRLSKDADLRKKLRLNGQKRALTQHSIPSIINKLMKY